MKIHIESSGWYIVRKSRRWANQGECNKLATTARPRHLLMTQVTIGELETSSIFFCDKISPKIESPNIVIDVIRTIHFRVT